MPAVLDDISAEILDLKKKIGATILAHYYQEGEIQELADITGDSLKLAREATKVDYAGHRLLRRPLHGRDGQDAQPVEAGAAARPAGRVQPRRRLPRRQARPLPGDAPRQRPEVPDGDLHQQLRGGEGAVRLGRHHRQRRGGHPPACRRTTRSCSCPTSTSGQYLEEVTGRKMILWDGSCMVHEIFSVGDLLKMKKQHPAGEDDRPPGVPGEHPASTPTSSAAPRR